jgi:hypothetical protein
VIETIHGPMAEDQLERFDGVVDNDVESTTWVEYRLKGELPPSVINGVCQDCAIGICRHVHRSAHVTVKQSPTFGTSGAGNIGGGAPRGTLESLMADVGSFATEQAQIVAGNIAAACYLIRTFTNERFVEIGRPEYQAIVEWDDVSKKFNVTAKPKGS